MRTLVIYATDEGQTGKIASRIADQLAAKHFPTDKHNIAVDPEDPIALDAYDAVIVGSPVHFSHYDARLASYLKSYQTPLKDIPSAFFSVSLGILSEDEGEQNEVKEIANAYLADTGWRPSLKVHFGGAITYSKYSWLKRRLMQLIVRKSGGPTDTQYDYEFTDWGEVDRFVDQFVELVESCKQPDGEYADRSIYAKPSRKYSLRNRDRRQRAS